MTAMPGHPYPQKTFVDRSNQAYRAGFNLGSSLLDAATHMYPKNSSAFMAGLRKALSERFEEEEYGSPKRAYQPSPPRGTEPRLAPTQKVEAREVLEVPPSTDGDLSLRQVNLSLRKGASKSHEEDES